MTPKTLKALKGSIKKWNKVILGAPEAGTDDCPLCQIFNNDPVMRGVAPCKGCPVREKTGLPFCGGTSYREWYLTSAKQKYKNGSYKNIISQNGEGRKAALKMYNFLAQLLPKRGAS